MTIQVIFKRKENGTLQKLCSWFLEQKNKLISTIELMGILTGLVYAVDNRCSYLSKDCAKMRLQNGSSSNGAIGEDTSWKPNLSP